jgi:hypothetical protein
MFSYRCPACGKQHSKADSFTAPFQTPCLRCRRPISVTRELILIHLTDEAGPPDEMDEAVTTAPAKQARAASTAITTAAPENEDDIPDAEDGEEEPSLPPAKGPRYRERPRWPPQPADSSSKGKGWVIVGGILGVVLLLGLGVGGYFLFGRGGKAKRPVAKGKTSNSKPVAKGKTPQKEKDGKKEADKQAKAPPEGMKPKNSEPIRLAAGRLSVQLAAEPAATNRIFDTSLVEVTGLFDRLEKPKVAPPPKTTPKADKKPGKPAAPPPDRVYFQTAGVPLFCEVSGTPAELKPWSGLRKGEPITVRGIHIKDGLLRACKLMPLAAVADEQYRGRELEVSGVIDAVLAPGSAGVAYPTVRLEGETFGQVKVDCLFRKDEEALVRKLPVGSEVTLRGTCNGRQRDKTWVVRLDNCRVESSTGAGTGVTRLPAPALARAYEEDLRPAPLPEWGKEDRLPGTLTVAQLDGEYRAGREAMEARYRYRILTVTGRLMARQDRAVVLESKDTDQPLKVECRFDRHAFALVDIAGPEPVLRGLCTRVAGGLLRLDNAEVVLPPGAKRDLRQVTADFLPHPVGRVLVYDIVDFPLKGNKTPTVKRYRWLILKDRITSVLTHQGKLPGPSMLDAADPGAWFKDPRTKAVGLPGPILLYRQAGGFAERGQVAGIGRLARTAWAPFLKIGARTDDRWSWEREQTQHVFRVAGFGERHGQPTVTIVEKVMSTLDGQARREITHVYVKGLGEVERREVIPLAGKEQRRCSEMRLIQVDDKLVAPPPREKGGGATREK